MNPTLLAVCPGIVRKKVAPKVNGKTATMNASASAGCSHMNDLIPIINTAEERRETASEEIVLITQFI
jgi:hypothetical protein